MDPIATSIAKATGTEAIGALEKEAESFLNTVIGEPAKARGGLLADKINHRRHKNLIGITVEAKRNLAEAGLSPKEVPLKFIHPLLDVCSLEEEPDIQTIWANMLANAADPRQKNPVGSSFSGILKELTSREVKLLDATYRHLEENIRAPGHILTQQQRGVGEVLLMGLFGEAGFLRFSNSPNPTTGDWREHAADIKA